MCGIFSHSCSHVEPSFGIRTSLEIEENSLVRSFIHVDLINVHVNNEHNRNGCGPLSEFGGSSTAFDN
jgi:hypothetical protein